MNRGYKFEVYCADLYRDIGKMNVTHNIVYEVRRVVGGSVGKVQVDIEYWDLLRRRTVECKYRGSSNVGAPSVESFVDKLSKLRRSGGIMVTNAEYSSTAARLADRHGIALLDHTDLSDMEKKRLGIVKRIFGRKPKTLEQLVWESKVTKDDLSPEMKTRYCII